jgi:hypothetical protein
MLADGQTQSVVAAWLSAHGQPMHRNTISHHKIHHCAPVVMARTEKIREDVRNLADRERAPRMNPTDLAVIVRDRTVDRLLDPNDNLDVTVAEGLRAQELLDRRMEKQGDRDLIVGMVFAITGYEPPGPTFEGTWVTRELPPRVIDPDEWVEPGE